MAAWAWLDPILNPLACLPPGEEPPAPQEAGPFLKKLEAELRMKLRHALSGEKSSLVRGQGLDFADLREYAPGDDIRKIDWNVFARTLTPHIKEFHEEKQLTLWLAADLSPSMYFGRRRSKAACVATWAGLLGLMAHEARHKLGAFVITPTGTEILSPKTGYAHLQHVMQRVLSVAAQELPGPDGLDAACFQRAFHELNRLVARNATVFALSDFHMPAADWQPALGELSRKASLISLLIHDPSEQSWPADLPDLPVYDPETGEVTLLPLADPACRARLQAVLQQRLGGVQATLRQMGPVVPVGTEAEPVEVLSALLGQTVRGMWR